MVLLENTCNNYVTCGSLFYKMSSYNRFILLDTFDDIMLALK